MEPQTVGFQTWLQVYEYLKDIGFEKEARVGFIIPPVIKSKVEGETGPKVKAVPSEIFMEMVEIRARAFDELYEQIPLSSSVEVVTGVFEEIPPSVYLHDANLIIEFLNKIPTKK